MQYRNMGRTGEKISRVSLGAEWMVDKTPEQVYEVIGAALEGGINYIDVFMAQAQVRTDIGQALAGRGDQVMLAGHLGAVLSDDGQYERTRDASRALRHIDDFQKRLGRDAIDVLMLHFVDAPHERDEVLAKGGLLEAALQLKAQGRAKHIGLSSHVPQTAQTLVETGEIDVLLFPVNPLHDTLGNVSIEAMFEEGSYAEVTQGRSKERLALYAACQRQGTGIVSMKTFAAGRLLAPDAPLGVSMTPVKCIHYALSQPSVCSAAVGCATAQEVRAALAYEQASEAEKDFSSISDSRLFGAQGACMYCNHCLPCPVGLDIAAITQILDAAKAGTMSAQLKKAATQLKAQPSTCTQCGHCAGRCPFGVDAPANMAAAAALFG